MKFQIKPLVLITFFALLFFTSCQDEIVEIIQPNEQETIVPGSGLANLMRSASANDGSYDNILDDSDCFSIELPVTIIINDITITIESEDDLDELEDLFEELSDNDDFLNFVFPFTIIFNDYTEIVIENQDQLESFINQCNNDEDDVIECIDFQYPISFSVFNTQFQVIDTIVIESDQELYIFLESLEDENEALLISLNYPVTLVLANGNTLEVNNNQELSEAIESAEDDCDDDPIYCNEEDIAQYLLECTWEIDDTNFNDFDDLYITFNANGGFTIEGAPGTSNVTGNWDLETTDIGVKLILSELSAFQEDLGGIWLITECEEDEIEIVKGDLELELDRDCETDFNCNVQEVIEDLQECYWLGVSNLIENFNAQSFYFTANGQVLIGDGSSNNEEPIGTYEMSVTGSNIYLILELTAPYQSLSAQWQLVECDDDRLEFTNNNDFLVFEQVCEDDTNVFDCFEGFNDVVLEACDENNDLEDGKAFFNLSANTIGLINCDEPFTPSFHETQADAEANLNAIINTEQVLSASTTVYLRIEASNGEFEVYPIQLIVVDCNPNEGCTETDVDNILQECIWYVSNYNGSDDLSVYQLDFNSQQEVIITNTNTNASFTAGWSTSGSTNGVILEFSNVAGPNIQAITGNWTIVECTEGQLVMNRENDQMVLDRDCDANVGCSEQDVLSYLLECVWVPVSYNGDDHLIDFVMQFNSDQSLVIEGGGVTITTTYSVQGGSSVFLFISGLDNTEAQDLGGDWTIVECNSERLELVSNNNILVLERDCN